MSGKTALVTGGAKGIGKAIALALAAKGYDVIINCRTLTPDFTGEGANETCKRIEDMGQKAYLCLADISTEEGRRRIIDCVDEVGRLDILINNVGIEPPAQDVLETTADDLRHVMGTNFYGPFAVTQQIAKRMIEWKKTGVIEQGRIGFITSIQADRVSTGVGYCISKAAVRNVVQQLAVRLGEADIPVLEFTPGVFLTNMSHVHEKNITASLEEGGWSVNRRWGALEEVGGTVAALADGVFDYSTGGVIPISGGMQIFRL